jgi:TrmH RNA methyltransferase
MTLYRAKLPAALDDLRKSYRIIGAAPESGESAMKPVGGKPAALVLGNEERGLDPNVLAACDAIATIPGSGRVQSLNVAAAAAILIHALSRGRS